jgi:hypothetical protein
MHEYSKRLTDIIEVVRSRPEWRNSHCVMEFGQYTIGYYDAGKDNCCFQLKNEGVVVTHQNVDSIQVELPISSWDTFNLNKWISTIEGIVKQEQAVINGKKYILIPVK